MSGAQRGMFEDKVTRTLIWRASPWGLHLNCSSMVVFPLILTMTEDVMARIESPGKELSHEDETSLSPN